MKPERWRMKRLMMLPFAFSGATEDLYERLTAVLLGTQQGMSRKWCYWFREHVVLCRRYGRMDFAESRLWLFEPCCSRKEMRRSPMKFKALTVLASTMLLLGCGSTQGPSTLTSVDAPPLLERILDTYVEASGGREALLGIEDRLCTGQLTWNFPDQDPPRLVIPALVSASGSDRYRLFLDTSAGPQGMGFDGRAGWVQNSDRIYVDEKQHRSKLAFLFSARGPLHLTDFFPDLGRITREVHGEQIVYRVESPGMSEEKEYLCFDARTGLLVQIGDDLKLGDFREVQGIMLPFRIEVTRGENTAVYTFDHIQHNLSLPKDKIDRPSEDQVFPEAFDGLPESPVLPLLIDFPSGHEDMNVPCRDGRYLYDLIRRRNYRRGLEIGTFTGYSALWFGMAFQQTGGGLVTLEVDREPGEAAQRNFQEAGLAAVIDARIGDAFAEIPKLSGEFDFVFVDAWKPDYMRFLKLIRDRIVPGGVLVAHNVTNHARDMQDFLKAIREDPGLETTLHEISAEGMSVSYVREQSPVDQEKISPDPDLEIDLPRYPALLKEDPQLPSPLRTPEQKEYVTGVTKEQSFALIPVTIENGEPYVYARHGKGKQLLVAAEDFPTLASTGLHSEEELGRALTITGRSLSEITALGRPESSSGVGFMARDEDIISVLEGDNRLVKAMGLTHPDLAKPMFHMWNLILEQTIAYRAKQRPYADIDYFLYNGKKVHIEEMDATKGWQESIFVDEIIGGYHIRIRRDLDEDEAAFLSRRYAHLSPAQRKEMQTKLTRFHTGEMEPYYIMRYGFYEGHTDYRVDPITIAFIFGLRDLEELESAFPGQLFDTLTTHFTGH